MNVFNKVTLESLKKNRTRTIVTIIGILLSAAMICASTTLVSSTMTGTSPWALLWIATLSLIAGLRSMSRWTRSRAMCA